MSVTKVALTKLAKMLSRNNISGRPFTVIVEGNIGSGKTTFLEHFKKYESVSVLAEPIELWRNCGGHNLLGHLYSDPKRWGCSFQSYVQLTMLKQHTKATTRPIKLMERSIYSAKYCFVEKMARDAIIAAPSAAVIDEWFKWIVTNVDVSVDLIVYLRTNPEVVHKRIMERNRQEEKTVSLEYLTDLHEMHEKWLYHKTMFTLPAPVITLDGNKDKVLILEEYEKYEPCILNKFSVVSNA